ncbi:hypothetical protein PFDSM3638_03250 [Pyrococcus furiosus DSM 3638]|uniref:Uncharacterized protein n=3 Tax=Pyrococcus furiosus TaxID=2261 RepID=A0A5C0XNW7_PYRFU|nr:DUF6345 domain-containing protein [Pyrococcus furiosus]AAL80775.1 hypothetical protein PF0651 [Pyrococcus furiosus DSM 3638]AFN03441.1 hypothetical protein PFC_02395 [Pyrococcus furiosus COM1]QEK78352.1 hypothetical protein PFDSM3638_03250 [Pyrococcus furiosus DSM 3638]
MVIPIKWKLFGVLLLGLMALVSIPKVQGNDVGGVMTFTDDTGDKWFNDVKNFVEIISSQPHWYQGFLKDYPNVGSYMWIEEDYGGQDNNYADYTELSLVLGHSCVYNNEIGIGFGDKGCALPEKVRLGYKSPDGYGWAIWTFIIQCSVLNDNNVNNWLEALAGIHMILGFAKEAKIALGDATELAYRLTGTGGYPKESVHDAFFDTYVAYDGTHNDNIARIIAENAEVADNDYLDSFDRYIPVDSTKIIITCSLG